MHISEQYLSLVCNSIICIHNTGLQYCKILRSSQQQKHKTSASMWQYENCSRWRGQRGHAHRFSRDAAARAAKDPFGLDLERFFSACFAYVWIWFEFGTWETAETAETCRNQNQNVQSIYAEICTPRAFWLCETLSFRSHALLPWH